MLDTSPLSRLARRTPAPDVSDWYRSARRRHELVVPEIADYEVRRELVRIGNVVSLSELDAFKRTLTYAPITTAAMLRAAAMWADARNRGRPTADPKELDCDVVLAAQALELGGVVATENVGHLSRYVAAYHWSAILP